VFDKTPPLIDANAYKICVQRSAGMSSGYNLDSESALCEPQFVNLENKILIKTRTTT